MHILFLSHYFPPEVNAPATRTFEHARRWVQAGHRVTVVTCAPNCPAGIVFDGYRNCWRYEEEIEGVRVIRVWTYLAANRGFFGRIFNFLSYMVTATWCAVWLRDIDVVAATSPQFFCGWAGVLCHWLRGWPFVLEVRDIWPESIAAVGAMRESPVLRLLGWLERKMYAAADRIVTVGDGYREQLLARGVPAGKIDVIPNGADLTKFLPGSRESRVESRESRVQSPEQDTFVCTYIGTVGMAHGLDVVLDAVEHLRRLGRDDVLFRIVGDGAERERLQHAATMNGLDNVQFLGMLPKERIPEIITGSDACLVHLRATELFGTVIPSKIFEIMAMNVPIIMGVRGQAQQIVLDAEAGVTMTPEDPMSLLGAIDRVAVDPQRYQQGRDYVARHFNRDLLAERMLSVLAEVAGEPLPLTTTTAPHEADLRKAA